MTVAVIWRENDHLWCAADSRLVIGDNDQTVTEMMSKIYSIPVTVHAQDEEGHLRVPHYWTQYGFVYAGSATPASMTAITAATLLQQLARQGGRTNPPRFEEIAELVRKLAARFITERRQFGGEGSFWSSFFGWCPHDEVWKVAYMSPQGDAGNFRVELQYPPVPDEDGAPWLTLGTGKPAFEEAYATHSANCASDSRHVPRLVIEKMIDERLDETVGGSVSVGVAHRKGFKLFHSEIIDPWDSSKRRRIFNGLDLDRDVGDVFPYHVATYPLP
ncbi:type II toxin-antitoxin system VapB family antitoxin [Mameliella alba]|uniref:hypothetical protein n=1 Tax=Mameliella alba TaxID=561184 RepID=UPI000B530EE7|nr:hypothetical protein [Mameliella alba]MBY6117825.1 type II toxin-antitoxin system VapB family antitoxin [Mameliella alba]OWV65191.1 hypothetical protein CDZ97_10095 [Mameliella alba]